MHVNPVMQFGLGSQSRVSVVVLAAVAVAVVACTSSAEQPQATSTTRTSTATHTRSPSTGHFTPPKPAAVRPLPPGAKPARGEKERACPYIRTGLNVDADGGVNLADLEGDRVYRNTVVTRQRPIGCRFYFYAPPYEAIAEIRPYTLGTPVQAYNAMIATARTGHDLITERHFAKGIDGICFRTKFFGLDGNRDWAFVFAKGKRLVIVYTQRTDTSRNALYIARAIAGKF
jgi:hypothetical protein